MEKLLQLYTEHTERLMASGKQMMSFDCPGCEVELLTPQPPPGVTWDSNASCPYCGCVYYKVAVHLKADAQLVSVSRN